MPPLESSCGRSEISAVDSSCNKVDRAATKSSGSESEMQPHVSICSKCGKTLGDDKCCISCETDEAYNESLLADQIKELEKRDEDEREHKINFVSFSIYVVCILFLDMCFV